MKNKIQGLYTYKIDTNDISLSLNSLKKEKIKIYNLKKIDDITYTFDSSIFSKNRIKYLFNNMKIIGHHGYFATIFKLFYYKTTIIAIILSIAFYFLLSFRIWKVNISGDSKLLLNYVETQLEKHEIKKGNKLLNNKQINQISKEILRKSSDKIEYLSIKKDGCVINVEYKKKREKIEEIKYQGCLYASKDGIIKSFDLLCGEKVVKENDYVKKGDLLVQDYIIDDYNNTIPIQTYGAVYAYTWYYLTLKENNISTKDNVSLYASLLLKAKEQISENFTTNEFIYSENVLQFKKEGSYVEMKIHFTCVENIARSY